MRGLWQRNGTFYAQLSIPDPLTGRKFVRRVRLEDKDGNPVPTLAKALKVMARLKVKREDQTLKLDPKRTPTFAEWEASTSPGANAVERSLDWPAEETTAQ